MNAPKHTHVKVLIATLIPLPSGEVKRELGDKVKVFSTQDWKKIQSVPAKNKFEFIEEIPCPDRDDVLLPKKTGGSETGAMKRYMEYLKTNEQAQKEFDRRQQALKDYQEVKKKNLAELVKKFKGKEEMIQCLAYCEIVGDIGATMTDEKNLGSLYEKYAGDMAKLGRAIEDFKAGALKA